jgi:hypothetical protein
MPTSLALAFALMYFYISTFRSMCAVPNIAVFCSSLTYYFFNLYQIDSTHYLGNIHYSKTQSFIGRLSLQFEPQKVRQTYFIQDQSLKRQGVSRSLKTVLIKQKRNTLCADNHRPSVGYLVTEAKLFVRFLQTFLH